MDVSHLCISAHDFIPKELWPTSVKYARNTQYRQSVSSTLISQEYTSCSTVTLPLSIHVRENEECVTLFILPYKALDNTGWYLRKSDAPPPSCRLPVAEMAERGRKDGGSAFGQEQPPLYIYIKRILERYPGGQIFKVASTLSLALSS